MTSKSIIVTISAEGEAEIEAHGFSDGACLEATKDLEQALGVVSDRKRTNHGAAKLPTATANKIGKA